MRCEELMKKDVQCIAPTDTAQKAAVLMRDNNVGFLPACGTDKKVLGAVTDRDITIRLVASGLNPSLTPVKDVMTREVVSVGPGDDISRAEKLMSENKKSRMLVLSDDGLLVGVISLSDIVQAESAGATATMRGVTSRESRAAIH